MIKIMKELKEFYLLDEASKLTGIPERTLRTRLNRGQLSGVKISRGAREIWGLHQSVLDALLGENPEGDFAELYQEWLVKLESGYYSGKPVGNRTLENYEYGFQKFWESLRELPSMSKISSDYVKLAMAGIAVDYEQRNCHYAIKEAIYKSLLSFFTFLIEKKLKTEADLKAIKKAKPKRIFPARKTVLQVDDLEKLLHQAESLTGRTSFDAVLGKCIIGLMAFAGLRREEVIDLEIQNIDLQKRTIQVIDGKGHKNRIVGIRKELYMQLSEWLKVRPKSSFQNLLLSKKSEPITESTIQCRMARLRKSTGLDITPHGLRRTFVTLAADAGIPLPHIQKQAGHSDIKTTMGYMLTDEMLAVDSIRNYGKSEKLEPKNIASGGEKVRRAKKLF
jgi:integrase